MFSKQQGYFVAFICPVDDTVTRHKLPSITVLCQRYQGPTRQTRRTESVSHTAGVDNSKNNHLLTLTRFQCSGKKH